MDSTLAFGMPGHWEWVIIGIIALLLFGSRLPSVARSVGDGIREFKKGLKDVGEEVKTADPRREDENQPKQFSSAKPPRSSDGEDTRVAHGSSSEDETSREPASSSHGG